MFRDMLDVEVNTGDWVVYPGRQSSNMWLSIAKVREVRGGSLVVNRYTKPFKCYGPDPYVIIRSASVIYTARHILRISPPAFITQNVMVVTHKEAAELFKKYYQRA